MLRTVSAPGLAPSTEMRGNGLRDGATDCTSAFAKAAARGIWPDKTAEHWAVAAGVEVRMAKYWLAKRVSLAGRVAIARLIL